MPKLIFLIVHRAMFYVYKWLIMTLLYKHASLCFYFLYITQWHRDGSVGRNCILNLAFAVTGLNINLILYYEIMQTCLQYFSQQAYKKGRTHTAPVFFSRKFDEYAEMSRELRSKVLTGFIFHFTVYPK